MVLWLEVNEHQHATCDPRREWDRCNQIWEHFGCRPALVIEFNPDSYESAAGDVVGGMFREKRTSTDGRRLWPTAEADPRMGALAAASSRALRLRRRRPSRRGRVTPSSVLCFTRRRRKRGFSATKGSVGKRESTFSVASHGEPPPASRGTPRPNLPGGRVPSSSIYESYA